MARRDSRAARHLTANYLRGDFTMILSPDDNSNAYSRNDLTMVRNLGKTAVRQAMASTISAARLARIFLVIHVLVPGTFIAIFVTMWGWEGLISWVNVVAACALFIIVLPIHEFIHYICFIAFGGANKKNVSIHFNKKNLVAYVVCNESISARRYKISAIAPFISVGLAPLLYGIGYGDVTIGIFGVSSILSCTGDMVLYVLLTRIDNGKLVSRYVSKVDGRVARIGFMTEPDGVTT